MRRGLALGEFGLPHYEELYRPRSAMAPRVAVRGVRRVRQVGGGGSAGDDSRPHSWRCCPFVYLKRGLYHKTGLYNIRNLTLMAQAGRGAGWPHRRRAPLHCTGCVNGSSSGKPTSWNIATARGSSQQLQKLARAPGAGVSARAARIPVLIRHAVGWPGHFNLYIIMFTWCPEDFLSDPIHDRTG
jgi:hypothetical protein